MNIFTGLMVYIIVWWLAFFTVLPWGNRPPEHVEPGHADSAPERPRLWVKAAITSVIAGVVWGVIYWAVSSDMMSFRDAV